MSLLFNYIAALTNLYGVVRKEKVVEVYNTQNDTKISVTEVESFATQHKKGLKPHSVEVVGPYFMHDSIITAKELETLMEKKREKPYYIPEKEELLRYAEDKYYEKTEQTKKLYEFLKKHLPADNVNSVEDVFSDVLLQSEMEADLDEVMNFFEFIGLTFDTSKDRTEAMDILVDFFNHTRLWSNNGFTPHEMTEKSNVSFRPEDEFQPTRSELDRPLNQVGRNDPCPCGSGKKYKKCCLH